MGVLVTCKTEEYPFKNEGARVVTKYPPPPHCKSILHFDDNQGQLTQQSEAGPTESSNSSNFYGCPCYLKE